MLHKLRSALVAPEREKLKGEVEVDECYIGGPEEEKPGRSKGKKSLVVVSVEIVRWIDTSGRKAGRHVTQYDIEGSPERQQRSQADGEPVLRKRAGRVRMTVIPDASAETLLPWIGSNIEKGTKIYTDGWKGYSTLEKKGYIHQQVFQTKTDSKESVLPGVHMVASLIKRVFLGTYHGRLERNHLQRYLDEYTFRFNRRNTKYVGKRFYRIVQQAVNTMPFNRGSIIL